MEVVRMKRILVLLTLLLFVATPFAFAQDACEGNFDCDQDVDGTDAAVFKEDFGRSPFTNPCETCFDSPCPCPTTSSTTTTTACPTFNICSHPDDCIIGNCCCTDGENYVCDDEANCLEWGDCVTTSTTTTCIPLLEIPNETCSTKSDCCQEDEYGIATDVCCCNWPIGGPFCWETWSCEHELAVDCLP